MTGQNIESVGKKRKLPHRNFPVSDPPSTLANSAMEQTDLDDNTTDNRDADLDRNMQKSIDDSGIPSASVEQISYVEFYSGVGGWTMALEESLRKLGPLLSTMRSKNTVRDIISKDMLHSVGASKPIANDHSSFKQRKDENKLTHRYELKRLAALDHSDLCVKVFSHNFAPANPSFANNSEVPTKHGNGANGKHRSSGKRKKSTEQKSSSIERIPLRQLEEWSADIWVMSPPCQPHTRQHNICNNTNTTNGDQRQQDSNPRKKDLEDPRSKSFLKICEWLEGPPGDDNDIHTKIQLAKHRLSDESLPSLILLENVVGFESSNSFRKWSSALRSRGYRVGHFHLTPTQVGLPNDRPRYYSIAIRGVNEESNSSSVSTPLTGSEYALVPASARSLFSYLRQETSEDDITKPKIWKAIPELNVESENDESVETRQQIAPISSILDDNNNYNTESCDSITDKLRVPEKVLKNQSAWCFDIVCPSDRRSSCFTHSYGRFIRGTGSILYDDSGASDASSKLLLLPPEQREFHADWMDHLDPTKLRYFSGMELARLFGFSKDFSFPRDTSLKQQWKLMGNSLNVRVASRLVELGFLLRYYHCAHQFGGHNIN